MANGIHGLGVHEYRRQTDGGIIADRTMPCCSRSLDASHFSAFAIERLSSFFAMRRSIGPKGAIMLYLTLSLTHFDARQSVQDLLSGTKSMAPSATTEPTPRSEEHTSELQ